MKLKLRKITGKLKLKLKNKSKRKSHWCLVFGWCWSWDAWSRCKLCLCVTGFRQCGNRCDCSEWEGRPSTGIYTHWTNSRLKLVHTSYIYILTLQVQVVFTMRLHVMQCTVLLLQFCPPVHLSARRVYCDKTKWCTADILIPHKTAITLVFWHQHWLVGDAPFHVKYSLKVMQNWLYRLTSVSYAFDRWRFGCVILVWWIALRLARNRTTGSADNCTMNFLDVGTHTVC